MATEVGKIFYTLDLDSTAFKKGAATASAEAESFGSRLGGMTMAASKAALAISAIGAAALTAGAIIGVKFNADMETARQGFITLLGSAEKADKTIAMIKKDAASTPFEVAGLVKANQLLTSITKDGEKSEVILMNVGKALAAMGKGQNELDRIIVNLQQIGSVGHASMIDIKQFAFAGIPIFEMLSEATGKTGQALDDMISNGEITFDVLMQMFDKAGSAGGRFENAFTNQAGTFNQLMSNLKDTANQTLGMLFEPLFNSLKKVMAVVSPALTQIQKDMEKAGGATQWIKDLFEKYSVVAGALAGIIVTVVILALVGLAGALWGLVAPLLPFLAIGAVIGILLNQLAISFGGWGVMIDMVKEKVIGIWNTLVGLFGPSIMALVGAIQNDLLPQLQRLWQTLEPGLTTVLKVIGTIIGVLVVANIWIMINVWRIVISIIGTVIAIISNLIQWFINLYNWGFNIAHGIVSAFNSIVNGVRGALSGIASVVSNTMSSVSNTINGWFSSFYNSGIRLIQSLGRGIADGVSYAVNAAKGVLNKVRDLLPFSDAKTGPLSDLTLSGQRFSETFAKGITQGADAITDATNNVLGLSGFGVNGVNINGGQGGGSSITNSIGNININSGVDGQDWLGKLTRQDQLISMGLSG